MAGSSSWTRARRAQRRQHAESRPRFEPRNVTWTHYYGVEDTYSRIDYILLSPAMARDWVTNGTYALTIPNWGVGSDHRPSLRRLKRRIIRNWEGRRVAGPK